MRQRHVTPLSLALQFVCAAIVGCSDGDAGLTPSLDVVVDDTATTDSIGEVPSDTAYFFESESDSAGRIRRLAVP